MAFNGHIVTEGPLRVEIAPIAGVSAYDKTYKVKVLLNNSSGFGKVVFYSIGTSVSDDDEAARSGRRPACLFDGLPQSRDRRRFAECPL